MSTDATEAPTPNEGEDQLQSTQAPSQETSATQTTEPEYFSENFDPSSLDEALQPAYKQMQGASTKKTQELAEQRKQAEAQIALASDLQSEDPAERARAVQWLHQNNLLTDDLLSEALGYQFDDDSTEEESDDPLAAIRAELEGLKTNLSAKEAQQAEEAYVNAVDEHLVSQVESINAQLKQQGRDELTDAEQNLIVKNALVDTPQGQMPDVNAAYQQYVGLIDGRLKGWAATKQGGATTAGGAAATEVPDLDNPQSRRDHLAEEIAKWQQTVGP